ncbi:low molecular weight protein arginine phosphatase [Anaerobacillus sp. CMMVII]|uniref:low molecular weight protein arginine phosphatase n=1 Tax=Anaerobacillus sp. CMMVII TaxID=2755588 RepID=UPI0021B7A130|nr:low molecular weight protein arginine phosphatase [Anaerobacillus sp. CMMVII]MCT8140091.1 low molecular weight protein arginine phosphatase [Anaerobacillus sp. CMMVII]
MKRFLFVCTGNTCRSPLAQALLKEKRPDIEVKSAGVSALPGMSASEGTVEVLAEKGISLNHSSSQVSKEMMDWADIVLTLTEGHKSTLVRQFPDYVDKIHTLKEYAFEKDLADIQQQLQHHYVQLELKQAQFLQEHKAEIEQLNKRTDNEAKLQLENLSKALQQLIKVDRLEIERLETIMPSFSISDPFGGSTEVYRRTAREIEEAIDKLLMDL